MKCRKPSFLDLEYFYRYRDALKEERIEFPDKLKDYLTGKEMPFSNRDYIRQKILKFLVEEKNYLKDDIFVDRTIILEINGQQILSLVDISININKKTLMVWKCSSGSLVSRERQIIASSRLLEDYVVPFAAVTNGKDLELLDTYTEKVIGTGFLAIPSRQEFIKTTSYISLKPANKKKIIYEQRILYTYDAISCPVSFNK